MTESPSGGGDAARVLASVRTELLIGGKWQAGRQSRTFEVEDPATQEVIATVADGDATDALDALEAASEAQEDWAATPPRERGEVLRRAFDLVTARADDLALLMTLEMGKPVAESRGEIAYAAEFLRWFSEEAVRISGSYAIAPDGGSRLITLRQPVGPCLLITPWNFPMAMASRKIGPAVAAGCTMVLKPADLTPLSSLALADILTEAGLPAGVLNVVTTTDAGGTTAPLIADPRLRKLSFTGSTPVGKQLIAASANQVLRVSMELGGNAPFLVFADADLDAAVEGAIAAKMRNGGQACTSANRFLVDEEVAEEFAARLSDRMQALVVGHGTDPGVDVGPLADLRQLRKVEGLVDEAVQRGAKPLCGGGRGDAGGYFYQPTVLCPVPPDADIRHQEIFGPVAPIYTFRTEAEAVAAANDTEFGLVAYVFTRDLDRARRVAEAVQTGMVGVNQGVVSNPAAPFGGVKGSGLGREGGAEGIDEYLDVKYLGIRA